MSATAGDARIDPECSVVTPCHNCDYCSGYYRWLFQPDYAENEDD